MKDTAFSGRLPDTKALALAIAENSVHGLVVMDEQGYCLYANRAWLDMTGFSEEEMRTKAVHDLVHHHHPDGRPFPIDECPIGCTLGKNERVRNHEDLFFKKDGTPFPVSCAASPIVQEGAPVLMILETRDITHEKKALRRLQESDRRKDEFLAVLAHELRNPLAPISAAADLLGRRTHDKALAEKASAIIARQVSHMTGLVDDLLDVSRVTRGSVSLKCESVDLKHVVLEAVEQVRPVIDARRHWLSIQSSGESTLVEGDPKRLVQVLVNLLNNAAKFTQDNGEIVLSVEVDGGTVQIAVTDNGIGMSAKTIEHAFDLFSQAERSSDRTQGGLGIGLALVKSLVNLHHGSVEVHSAGVGMGTRVTITLPRLEQAMAQQGSGEEANQPGPPATPLKIMVVDDNDDATQALALLLNDAGHQVLVEHNPWAALERARNETPDVLLLDIGLPEIDGHELARRIRRQEENSKALLVALTGYGQDQDRSDAFAAGFDHFLVKPASMHELAALLNRHRESADRARRAPG